MQLPSCLLQRIWKLHPIDHTPENGVRFWELGSFLHLAVFTSTWLLTTISSKALRMKRASRLVSRGNGGVRTGKTESHSAARSGEKEPEMGVA